MESECVDDNWLNVDCGSCYRWKLLWLIVQIRHGLLIILCKLQWIDNYHSHTIFYLVWLRYTCSSLIFYWSLSFSDVHSCLNFRSCLRSLAAVICQRMSTLVWMTQVQLSMELHRTRLFGQPMLSPRRHTLSDPGQLRHGLGLATLMMAIQGMKTSDLIA